jgi:hypothetical protein
MKKFFIDQIRTIGIFILIVLLNSSLISQDEFDFSLTGSWTDGPCNAIDTFGSMVIISNGCNFEILDFSDTSELVPVSKYFSQGVIYNLKVKDNTVFLGLDGEGLSIVDISDIHNPHETGFLKFNGYYPDIQLLDNKLLYTVNYSNGLYLIDISNLSSPQVIKNYLISDIISMNVRDNYIYTARGWQGMSVYQLNMDNSITNVFNITNEYCYDVEIKDDTMCVLTVDTLMLIDIANPVSPDIFAEIKVSDAYNCSFYKNFIICSGYGMQSIDISNPNQPKIIHSVENGISARNMLVKGNIIFLPLDSKGLKIFNIDHSGNIVTAKVYKTQGYSNGVTVKNKTAYLAQYGEGISILDITDQADIKWIKSIPLNDVTSVKILDKYLICSNEGLQIFDISSRFNPVEISYFDLNTTTHGMKVSGNTVYLASGSKGLTIFNISDVNNIKKVGEYNTPGNAWDVDVKDNRAFIADLSEGLRIINITDPANPFEIASTKILKPLYSVSLAGNYAYVGSANFGVRVLDVLNPEMIPIVKYLNSGRGYNTLINENFAYISGGYEGMFVYDITDPGDPVKITSFDTPGHVYDVFAENNYVYLADYNAGFNILKKCPRFTVSTDYDFVRCFGQCNGWIEIKNVLNASAPVQYRWNNGLNTSKIQGLCKGTYTVTISDSQNCSVSMSFDITEPKAIKIETLAKTDITAANPKGSVSISISGGVTPYSYEWSGPDGFISTQQNLSGLEKGCYSLSVTDANDCLFVADPVCIEDKTSGTSDSDGQPLFRISPNPADVYIILELLSPQCTDHEVEVTDINGNKMQTYDQVLTDRQNSLKIDISHFPQGFYCMRLRDKNGRFVRNFKLVKM